MKSTPQAASICRSMDQVRSFVKEIEAVYMLDRPIAGDCNRREVERINLTMPVRIRPLQERSGELNYVHHGITRDISYKGIGLVTTDPIKPGNVMLTLEPFHGEPFGVTARITYCNELGYYFQVGCEFLASQD